MKTYTPRRANLKRWLEGAPEHILDCFDSRGPGERYTVFITGEENLIRTESGVHIQYFGTSEGLGISGWGEMLAHQAAAYRYRFGRHRIKWADLPEAVRNYLTNLTPTTAP